MNKLPRAKNKPGEHQLGKEITANSNNRLKLVLRKFVKKRGRKSESLSPSKGRRSLTKMDTEAKWQRKFTNAPRSKILSSFFHLSLFVHRLSSTHYYLKTSLRCILKIFSLFSTRLESVFRK